VKVEFKRGDYVFYCGYDGGGSMAPGVVLQILGENIGNPLNADVYWILQERKSVVPLRYLTNTKDKRTNV
jgi:hypothetical protein